MVKCIWKRKETRIPNEILKNYKRTFPTRYQDTVGEDWISERPMNYKRAKDRPMQFDVL